jgi:hypothetical protein
MAMVEELKVVLAVCVPEAERSKQHINPKVVAGSPPYEAVRVWFLLAMAC